MLLQKPDKSLISIVVPYSSPILHVESCNAESLYAVMQDRLKLGPLWHQLRSLFPLQLNISTCDSASSNLKYEAALASEQLHRLRLPCEVHLLSRVASRTYAAVAADISGMIAMCLASRDGGAMRKLREALATVIADSTVVSASTPPGPSHPHALQRDRLLDLCLSSSTASDAARKVKLQAMLTGDTSEPRS